MLIEVRLLQYGSKIFTYEVPIEFQSQIAPGVLVKVPLRRNIVAAIVHNIMHENHVKFAVKPISSLYQLPQDLHYLEFIKIMGNYYQTDTLYFLRRLQHFLTEKEHEHVDILDQTLDAIQQVINFTFEQQQVYNEIKPFVQQQKHQTFVLHGVTGSGKTEIYKRLIADAIAQKKSSIVLLPEVTLALQFEKIFANHFNSSCVIGFHSATSVKNKKKLWQALLDQTPIIIIGVHLPILLPIANLGLIIVDEEHDAGYQEKKHPKLHSRDMAVLKASLYKIPIVLGSATPSLQSLWNVKKRDWKLLTMLQRYSGKFPQIKFVSLKTQKKRKHFWITDELYQAIQDRLEKKQQIIIFLNRRGYSFFVQCCCGFVFSCYQCSVSLTLHQDNALLCHYCGYKSWLPLQCPTCEIPQSEFLKKGIGTQQLAMMFQKLFPQANIARADLDTTSKKRSWAQTVDDMQQGKIDILIGTQTITKGYHFAGVTLVGILWADLNLHFPVYNAAETALQQLIQVAGRAGRQSQESLVVVQAFDEHQIFDFIDETLYQKFYEHEITKRIEVEYPPHKHIAEIELKGTDQLLLNRRAHEIVHQLKQIVLQQNFEVTVLGPVPAIVYKIKNSYSQKIFLKSFSRSAMIKSYSQIAHFNYEYSIFFTIDPV